MSNSEEQKPPPPEQTEREGGSQPEQAKQPVEQPAEVAADFVAQADAAVDDIKDIPDRLAGSQADELRNDPDAGPALKVAAALAEAAGVVLKDKVEATVRGSEAAENGEAIPAIARYKEAIDALTGTREVLAQAAAEERKNPTRENIDKANAAQQAVDEAVRMMGESTREARAAVEKGPHQAVLQLLDEMGKLAQADINYAANRFSSEKYQRGEDPVTSRYRKEQATIDKLSQTLLLGDPDPALRYIEEKMDMLGGARFGRSEIDYPEARYDQVLAPLKERVQQLIEQAKSKGAP